MWWPRAVLLAIVAGAALLTAACSGGSSTPQVASLGNSSDGGGNSAGSGNGSGNFAATGSGNATQLVDDWATCMHGHGDPNQVDPTIDSDGDIEISMTNVTAEMSAEAHDSTGPCGHYLNAASTALRAGRPAPKVPSLASQLKYAECMRAHGVPNYPDPNGSTEGPYIGNLDPAGAVFVNADKLCSKKTGEISSSDPAPAGVVQVRSINGAPPGGGAGPAPSGAVPVSGGPGASG